MTFICYHDDEKRQIEYTRVGLEFHIGKRKIQVTRSQIDVYVRKRMVWMVVALACLENKIIEVCSMTTVRQQSTETVLSLSNCSTRCVLLCRTQINREWDSIWNSSFYHSLGYCQQPLREVDNYCFVNALELLKFCWKINFRQDQSTSRTSDFNL